MAISQDQRKMPFAVVVTSIISASLALIHLFVPGVEIDNTGLVFILLAIIPWLVPYLQKSVKAIDILGNKIEFLETEISKQQRIINDLVIFSISSSLFEILSYLHHKKKEYRYHPTEGNFRNLRYLRNHGYLHYFRFDELHDNQDLSQVLRLTPAGELLVRERERRERRI